MQRETSIEVQVLSEKLCNSDLIMKQIRLTVEMGEWRRDLFDLFLNLYYGGRNVEKNPINITIRISDKFANVIFISWRTYSAAIEKLCGKDA